MSTPLATWATVDSFTPVCGVVGRSVTITGSGFSGANGVVFNGTPALTWSVLNDTTATATVPDGSAHIGRVRVSTPGNTPGNDRPSHDRFTVVAAGSPRIWTSPETGAVGASVTITGRNFCGITGVSFNTTAATTFTVLSVNKIIAQVPAGATTGPLHVTTRRDTANSFADFTVRSATRHRTHDRSVSLKLISAVAVPYLSSVGGTVTVADGFDACRSNVTVTVQRLKNGVWRPFGALLQTAWLPSGGGQYHAISWPDKTGKYRAIVKRERGRGVHDICAAATSPTVYHRHHH